MTHTRTPDILDLGPAPRLLWLAQDPAIVRRCLEGETLDAATAGTLRSDVSTDEITPVAILSLYDQRLARHAYTGLHCGSQAPVAPGSVQQATIKVTVAGRRYGKGSSREHSPAAERMAGVRLVVAESFERLYRQNADNIGLFTSTDMGLPARIAAGEPVTLDEVLAGREPLAAAILRAGGLLRFGQAQLQDARPAPLADDGRPRTLYEKIVRRHLLATPATPGLPQPGDGCFLRADLRFIHEYYTGMAAHLLASTVGTDVTLREPQSIVVFEDHTNYMDESPAHLRSGLIPDMRAMVQAQRDFVARHGLSFHRALTDAEAARGEDTGLAGISHALVAERYALPGQVVVGTDSHTPHSGALGCLAFGVGTTDMANAFVTGAVRMTMAAVLRVELEGMLPPGVSAKDIVLHLLALPDIRAGRHVGQVFEFGGPVVRALPIDERATLTNMTAELGGLTGLVEPDEETLRFIRERRGVQVRLEPWMRSDPGCGYAGVIRLDCSALSPMVAAPGDPGNAVPLDRLQAPVRVDIAYGGSCTAGKREDFAQYHAVLAWALAHGLRVPDGVQLLLQYGTTAVRDWCRAQGWDAVFAAAGARILQPSCGACANCGPGSSAGAGQVTVSAINRNFPGRSGPGQVWLASPATVMASALAGELCSFAQLQARVRGASVNAPPPAARSPSAATRARARPRSPAAPGSPTGGPRA